MKIKVKRKKKKKPSRLFCADCPARKEGSGYSNRIVLPDGPKNAAILAVGEAPGREEDDALVPFVGKTGRYLRDHMDVFEFDSVRYSNVVRCRPPENRTPTVKTISTCSQYLLQEIERVDPKVVLLLGNTPLKAVLGESGITNWRGTPFNKDGRLYLPTYHPSYVLRQLNAGAESTYDEWTGDLTYVANYLNKSETPTIVPDRGWTLADSEKKLKRMLVDLQSASIISFDSEVATLDPLIKGASILCVSFSSGETTWVVPVDHPDSVWKKNTRSIALDAISEVLKKCPVVGHNLKFDMLQLQAVTGIPTKKPTGDTMVLSSLIDPRRGIHGLKRLAAIYLWMADYDEPLKEYIASHKESNPRLGGSYASIPGDVLFPYAALDAIATYHLWSILREHEDFTDKQRDLHDHVLIPALEALTSMEFNGIMLDMDLVERYNALYQLAIQQVYNDIITHSRSIRYLIRDKRKEGNSGYLPNLGSYIQVGSWLYDYEGLECLKITDKGNRSVDAEALSPYVAIEPAVERLVRHRLYTGIYSKYLGPPYRGEWQGRDGRVRSTYNINGAITGRLSSARPNMQNIPTPEKEPGTLLAYLPVKNLFRATHEHLLQADYSGMELRTFASLADSDSMRESFELDIDIHTLVTSRLYGVEIGEVTKELRYRGKWVNWTILFGGDEHTLTRMYGIDLDEGKQLIQTYYDMFPEVVDFHEYIVDAAEEQGFYETVFGRRLYAVWLTDNDDKKRRAERRTFLNFPIQSTASDVLLIAMAIIYKLMKKEHMKSKLVNTVHDSILTDVYPGELHDVAVLQREVMENVRHFAYKYMPSANFDWLTVPLVADLEIGSHYGSLERYTP